MFRLTAVIFTMVLGLVFFLGLTLQAAGKEEGERILQQRCSVCHTLTRVYEAEKDREGWEYYVERMIRMGARVTPEENPVLVDYLTEKFSP